MAKRQNFRDVTISMAGKQRTYQAPIAKLDEAYSLGTGSGQFLMMMVPYLKDSILEDAGEYNPSDSERVKNGKKLQLITGLLEASYELDMMEMDDENMMEESWMNDEDYMDDEENEDDDDGNDDTEGGKWEEM